MPLKKGKSKKVRQSNIKEIILSYKKSDAFKNDVEEYEDDAYAKGLPSSTRLYDEAAAGNLDAKNYMDTLLWAGAAACLTKVPIKERMRQIAIARDIYLKSLET